MRKNLLILAAVAALTSGAEKVSAQLAVETFNAGIPATWTLRNDGHTSTVFNPASSGGALLNDSLTHNAWIRYQLDSAGHGYSLFTSSYFTTAVAANRWIISPSFQVTSANTILQWEDWDGGTGEALQVLVSPTGDSAMASFTATAWNNAPNSSGFVTRGVSLSSYNGQTIRIAMRDNTNNQGYVAIDNIGTQILANATDLSLVAIAPTAGTFDAITSTGGSATLRVAITNKGALPVSSAVVYYKQGTNAVVSQTVTFSPALQPLATQAVTLTTPISTPTVGAYPVNVYVAQPGDPVHNNDTLSTTITAIASSEMQNRMQMFEEFTGASCDPCANAVKNVDSVCLNNTSRMNYIRYHIDIPARDLMYNMTSTLVDARANYYNLSGVPDGQLNGSYIYPGYVNGGFTSAAISAEGTKTPIEISGTATYNDATKTYNVTANVKAHAALAAGLVAHIALTIDEITYNGNISLESISQTQFPDVVENMFPSAAGTTLTAFTAGQTQTITSSWVKNHNWGDVITGRTYTASSTGKITIWVEDQNTQTVFQSFSVPLSGLTDAGSTTAVTNVFGGNSNLELYPNPTSASSFIGFDLKNKTNVTVEVIDAVGRVVNTIPSQTLNAGSQKIEIPTNNLGNGIYNVKVTTEAGSVTKRLTVVKN